MDQNLTYIAKFKKLLVVRPKMAIIIAVVIIIGALIFAYKDLFIAATVNGSPISRLSVVQMLESSSGKQALDSLITERLINTELDKNKVSVSDEEVSAKIKGIEEGLKKQGSTLDEALASRNMTRDSLKKQITTQLRIEKFFSDKANVTDEEVAQYIKDNKVKIPAGQEIATKAQIKNELKSQKLNQAVGEWVDSLRKAATIKYYKNY